MTIILRENEKIIKAVRQHGLFLVPRIVIWLLIIGALSVWHWYGHFDFYGYASEVLFGVSLVGLLAVLAKIIFWRRTVLWLTNQRFMCHVQKSLFSQTVVEMLYHDIKEISYEKQGLYASLFNYGNLYVHAASDTTHVFERVPKPEKLVEVINTVRT